MASYSLDIANKWKVGSKERNDGILIVISKTKKEIHIKVGTGLEDTISNEKIKQIIDNIIIPKLKEGYYYDGIRDGINSLIEETKQQ